MKPVDEQEVASILKRASTEEKPLEITGAGSKRMIGRPLQTSQTLSTENLRGVTLYEPTELVVSAKAGTPLVTIERELAKHNQHLAFEPADMSAIANSEPGKATIGGIIAANISGSRRIFAGAARDHLLGIRAVNGRGELFKAGGRVMKNVTGYDLCRTLAGSWGTLSVITEITLKVLPRPEETRTLILTGLPDEMAIEVMCAAMTTPFEVSGTVHLQAEMAGRIGNRELAGRGQALTVLRIENISSSVAYRAQQLTKRFAAYGELIELEDAASHAFWRELQGLSFLRGSNDPVWRISTAPTMGQRVVSSISGYMPCKAAYDWSGGLVWLEVPDSADAGSAEIRRVVATLGGHATLMRAAPSTRASVEVFQPLEKGLARLTKRLKETFDPNGILNPGRMYADV